MRILYDGYIYTVQATGGVNRYFANLIAKLPPDWSPVLTATGDRQVQWPAHPRLQIARAAYFRPTTLARQWSGLRLQQQLRSTRPDVQHPTYYLHLANFKAKRRVPVVLTVYDFIHERFGEQLDPTGAFAALKRRAIEAADAVICISHATKVDLHTFCTVPDERVHVVPLASELNVSMATGDEPLPTRPYFLCVGGRAGYKNFDALLRVFARTLSKRDVALCVAGAPLSPAEAEQIATLHLSERVEVMPYPSDAHLARLYAQSLAFVHPSLYEGFGLPLLEAMACGAPVIAADNSSVPEVVGDEALLFPSGDADALAERLLAVFEGQVERATLVQRGFERAAGFSWERTAAQTVEVYRGLGG